MIQSHLSCCVFFFNDTATTEIYTLSLHDALPIYSVRDDMGSIMDLAKTEGMLFKWGSGTGTNFSTLRGSKETLSAGGIASGPVSFMKGFDAFAGVIKRDRKSTRLNSSHSQISYAVFC